MKRPAYKFFLNTFAIMVMFSSRVWARTYDNYRVDYSKNVFCTMIGGACASDNNKENSLFQNPASVVTEKGVLYDGDYVFDENVEPGAKDSTAYIEQMFMAGLGWSGPGPDPWWGIGFTTFGYHEKIEADALYIDSRNRRETLRTTTESVTLFFNFLLGYWITSKLKVGLSLMSMYNKENLSAPGSAGSYIKDDHDYFPHPTITVGGQYTLNEKWKLGTWFRSSKSFHYLRDVSVQTAQGLFNFEENITLNFPWQWSLGFSYKPFFPEQVVFFDMVVVGTTQNGLQRTRDLFVSDAVDGPYRPKGRSVALEPHLGFRTPWFREAKGYIHTGLYYEAGRWEDLPGRLHGTFGVSYKINHFEPLIGLDLSNNYFQVLITVR